MAKIQQSCNKEVLKVHTLNLSKCFLFLNYLLEI